MKQQQSPLAALMKTLLFIYRNLFELIVLNLSFVLCALPVVTAPAAVWALHETMVAARRETDYHLIRHYWNTVLRPKREQYFTLLPVVLVQPLLAYGLLIYLGAKNVPPLVWMGCGFNAVAFALAVAVGIYLVPWMVATGERYGAAWKHALFLALAKLPQTVVYLAGIALVWGVCLRWFRQCWIAFFLIVFSLSALIGVFGADQALAQTQEQEEE